MMRAVRYGMEAALVAFIVFAVFGCTTAQIDATNAKLVEAEKVAYIACLARQKAPIVAQALRDTLVSTLPGTNIAQGVIAGSCDIILANPGTTVTFATKGQ